MESMEHSPRPRMRSLVAAVIGCLLSGFHATSAMENGAVEDGTAETSADQRHEKALEQLQEWNAQVTYRDDHEGAGTIIIATDGAWQGGDDGLGLLKDVEGLYKLRLGGRVTDAGLAHLAQLKQLTSLDVHVLNISDAGVVHLKDLTELRRLNLTYTKVSDKGLAHLAGLTRLKWLGLAYTQVTAEGAKAFREKMPKTIVEGNFKRAGDSRRR